MTAGDPSLAATKRLIASLEKGGADIIELGVPFSDPMADGPVIQRASERALRQGATLKKILNLVAQVRKKGTKSPILLMGYYNPILAYGLKEYARDAARAGVDATLVVDLPPEESAELDRELKKAGIDLIYLLTPTSDAERIGLVARRARGFLYFVSITGITGAALRLEKEIQEKVGEIRRRTRLPIAVGFGISKPAQAAKIAKFADGVVVGSALVSLIAGSSSERLGFAVERFARRMRLGLIQAEKVGIEKASHGG
jgi:tryptophan synthase alpha chain